MALYPCTAAAIARFDAASDRYRERLTLPYEKQREIEQEIDAALRDLVSAAEAEDAEWERAGCAPRFAPYTALWREYEKLLAEVTARGEPWFEASTQLDAAGAALKAVIRLYARIP